MPSTAISSLPRRRFLHQLPLATGAVSTLLTSASASASTAPAPSSPIHFGLISDTHQDIMHDGLERVSAFIKAMTTAQAEFIVQLGEFCQPLDHNQAFLHAWNRFPRPRHHVLRNHDMDGGAPREKTASYHWVGDTYAHDSYPETVLRDHPWIRRTCPYRDPLWAQITIDPVRGILEVEGRTSAWVGPSPTDLGIPTAQCPPESTVPAIRHRRWPWPNGIPA